MHFYPMGRVEVLALPMKTFWLMSANIDRIQAHKDMRSLTVAVCGQGGEAATEFRKKLIVEAGTIVKTDAPVAAVANLPNAERDEVGFAELKVMSNLM